MAWLVGQRPPRVRGWGGASAHGNGKGKGETGRDFRGAVRLPPEAECLESRLGAHSGTWKDRCRCCGETRVGAGTEGTPEQSPIGLFGSCHTPFRMAYGINLSTVPLVRRNIRLSLFFFRLL